MKRFAIALFALFMSAAVFAQSDLQVLAVVKLNKNESITVKKLKTRVEMYEKQRGTALSVDDRKKVLDALIQEKLVLQAAAKAGFTITDTQVNQYFLQSVSAQIGRKGKLAVKRAGVVQKDERMHACARGIRAGALARVLVDVDPAVVEAFLEDLYPRWPLRLGVLSLISVRRWRERRCA